MKDKYMVGGRGQGSQFKREEFANKAITVVWIKLRVLGLHSLAPGLCSNSEASAGHLAVCLSFRIC